MARKRSQNLGDVAIKEIVEILDGWSGKLTWELLIDAVASRTYSRYTRQALHKHERIRLAFEVQKRNLAGGVGQVEMVGSPELRAALERMARLEAENRRLESENASLLEQFVRWAYNAQTQGFGAEFLNRALPPVNRSRTDKPG